MQEYTEGDNLRLTYLLADGSELLLENDPPHNDGGEEENPSALSLLPVDTEEIKAAISPFRFHEIEADEKRKLKGKGYRNHPPKLYLHSYLQTETGEHSAELSLKLCKGEYIDQLVYRTALKESDLLKSRFKEQVIDRVTNRAFHPLPWGMLGVGCWIRTRDNYLVTSLRNGSVTDEVGNLSYSSSGSCLTLRENGGPNTPGNAMVKEIREEVGIGFHDLRPEDLTLIAMGVDLGRYLIQLSYVWDCPYTAEEIKSLRSSHARDAREQTMFFLPLSDQKLLFRLLRDCEFEPGAACSLYLLLKKGAGEASH